MSTEQPSVKDEMYAEMLPDFLDEAAENLDRLNEHLLHLDEQAKAEGLDGCDMDVLNEMFRAAHTLKGLSGMLGLSHINALTHKVENVFDAARSNTLELTLDVIEVVFDSIDRLSEMLGRLREGEDDAIDCENVLNDIAGVLQRSGVERPQTSQQDAEQAMQVDDRVAEEATSPTEEVEATEEVSAAPEPATENVDSMATADEVSDETVSDVVEAGAPAPSPTPVVDVFAGIQDDVDLTSKYLSIFVDESELTLDQLTEALLAGADENVTEKVLILCHRMKGSAATIGLQRAAKLAHCMEDLLQVLHDQGAQLTVEMTDAMLDCTEALRVFVGGLKKGQSQTEQFFEVYQKLIRSQEAAPTTNLAASSAEWTPCEPQSEPSPGAAISEQPKTDAVQPADAVNEADVKEIKCELSDELCVQVAAAAPSGAFGCIGCVVFRRGLPDAYLKAQLIHSKLTNTGDLFYCNPSEEQLPELDDLRVMTFGLDTDSSPESLRSKLQVDGVINVDVRLLENTATPEVPPPAAEELSDAQTAQQTMQIGSEISDLQQTPVKSAAPAPAAAEKSEAAKPVETVRVDIDRLDQLMNLAGQLVINKARFAQITGSLRSLAVGKQNYHSVTNIFGSLKRLNYELDICEQGRNTATTFEDIRAQTRRIQSDMEAIERRIGQLDTVRHSINELLEAVHQLDRVSHGIQKSVMDTRMVPIGPLFTRFKRVVRDIARSNSKEVRLVIRGEKTELDKRMIDELGDPLIHIVRNSADHGIELPEIRAAAGKPCEGTVTLDASHRGNSIVIQVTDDGKGLDADKIRQKAVDKGLLTAADAQKMSNQQAFQLIWEPGLSTAAKVTEVSGRGMGMDIVRSKIEEINGTVELDSEPGQGTTITIKLPLTLAILPSLLAEIDGDVFAVPVESVAEIVKVEAKEMSQVHGLETATVRGRVISVVELTQVFEWHQAAANKAESDEDHAKTLVIVGSDGQEVGLVVDRLLGEEDIVIKSLAENYRNVEGIAGASILGDGRVSLILDVGALVERASRDARPACTT